MVPSNTQFQTLCAITLLIFSAVQCVAQGALLDCVQFGEQSSEDAHAFAEAASVVEAGGLGEPCRRIGPDGHLRWMATCDPERPNYVTVKLWGSDIGPGQLYLYDGEERIGRYQSQWPELDNAGGHRGHDPVHPGRFFYSTYLLPDEMTRGRSEIALTIGSTGQPTPYSATRKEAPQGKLSRGIYRAYVTTDPFFEPLPDEKQGAPPIPAPPLTHEHGLGTIEFLRGEINDAVDLFLSWQYFGEEWDAWVAGGKGPAQLTGAFCIGGARSAEWSAAEYRDQLAKRMGGNRVGLLLPEIWARAYHAPWSPHFRDEEIIQRVALALDYARLAQGNNGGFDDIWSHRWVGGPQRRRAGNCLEGFGHMGIAAAFLLLQEQFRQSAYMDRTVDDDGDPDTPAVSRRRAWARLFVESRNYLTSDIGRGHAPNQDMSDIVAAYLADSCVQVLAPGEVWPPATVARYLDVVFGLAKDVYGGYWITPKGISCEPHGTSNGGYCGCYGDLTGSMFRLARLTGDEALAGRALECAHALGRFRYPSLDASLRPAIRREGVTTWRNNWTPGEIDYGGNPYAAVVLQDQQALRAIQLAASQGGFFRIEPFLPGRYNVHLPAVTASIMRDIDLLEQALALPETDARLPFEPGQPDFAWADEQAAAVVVKRGETRLVMSLNWRHGFGEKPGFKGRQPGNAVTNDIARVHYTTPTVERIANVRMESPHGFGGLYVCRYGPYLVVMNANWSRLSEDADGPVAWNPPDGVPERAVDLISGQMIGLTRELTIPEDTTLVLHLGS